MTRSKQILILLVSLVALAATAPTASAATTPNPWRYAEPDAFRYSAAEPSAYKQGSTRPNGFRAGSVAPSGLYRGGSLEPKVTKIRFGAPAALKGKAEPEWGRGWGGRRIAPNFGRGS